MSLPLGSKRGLVLWKLGVLWALLFRGRGGDGNRESDVFGGKEAVLEAEEEENVDKDGEIGGEGNV
jgi:hypothetical protein